MRIAHQVAYDNVRLRRRDVSAMCVDYIRHFLFIFNKDTFPWMLPFHSKKQYLAKYIQLHPINNLDA